MTVPDEYTPDPHDHDLEPQCLPHNWERLSTHTLEGWVDDPQFRICDRCIEDVIDELSLRDSEGTMGDPYPTDTPVDQLDYPHNQPPER